MGMGFLAEIGLLCFCVCCYCVFGYVAAAHDYVMYRRWRTEDPKHHAKPTAPTFRTVALTKADDSIVGASIAGEELFRTSILDSRLALPNVPSDMLRNHVAQALHVQPQQLI